MLNKVISTPNIPLKLFKSGSIKYFKKNEVLIHQGDIIEHFYILIKGKVIVYKDNEDGSLYYGSLLVSPCVIGEANVITQEKMYFNIKCIEDSEFVEINKYTLIDLMGNNADINIFLYSINTSNYFGLMARLYEYSKFSSESRIIKIFREFVEVFGVKVNNKIKIDYNFNQQFISDLANVKRSTTVRTIRKLKDKNVIQYLKGNYYVTDIDLLKEISLQKEVL